MEFWSSSFNILLLIVGFISRSGYSAADLKALHCYRCMSMKCSTSPEICSLAKAFAQTEIEKYYYTDGYSLPECPSKFEDWEEFANKIPSVLPCNEFAKGQATCVLGRFQINSLVVDTNINLTTFGTVLGCAKKQLLDSVKTTTLGKNKKVITSLHTQMGCHSDHSESDVRDSLQHFLQLEHCSKITDMCYTSNYCIHPLYADVRSFRENNYSSPRSGINVLAILIWVAVLIGIIIVIMTFAGIKYA